MRRPVIGRAVTSTALVSSGFTAATVALVAGLLLAWPAGPAQARAASAPSAAAARYVPERFRLTSADASSDRQHVQATGVFTARGYALAGDFASRHAVSRLVFRYGALRLVTRATHGSVSVPNASTCKFTEVYSGDYVIRGGTGRYRNASGSGTYVSRIFGKLKTMRGGGCGTRLASFWQSTRTAGSLHR